MTYFAEHQFAQKQIRPIKPSTAAEYAQVWTRLNGEHWLDYAASHQIKSKSSLAVLRAAWRRGMALRILHEIEAVNTGQEHTAHADTGELDDHEQIIHALYGQLNDDIRGVVELLPNSFSHTHDEPKFSPKKTSKRQSLSGLPDDWRSQLIRAMSRAQDRLALMVIAMTGARPEELRMGVDISVDAGGRCLTFRIQGAKVSEITGGGQLWRELTVDPRFVLEPDLVVWLWAYLQEHQITTIQIDQKNAFQKRLQRVRAAMAMGSGNEAWKKISAYSFRHQFAADLKADSSIHFDDISAAMGHVSDRTKQHYGHAKQKRGKGGVSQISAASPIKVHRKSAASQVFLSKAAKRSKNQRTDATLNQK